MEERKFLHKLCVNALQVDYSIEFAGIVDSNGKLLVGRSRDMFCYNDYYKKRRKDSCLRYSNSYGKEVFKDKLVSVNNIKSIVSLQSNLFEDQTLFKLINLNNDSFIAYIPINEINDKFLYIYFSTGDYLDDVFIRLDSIFT
jgi:hypothetical protein